MEVKKITLHSSIDAGSYYINTTQLEKKKKEERHLKKGKIEKESKNAFYKRVIWKWQVSWLFVENGQKKTKIYKLLFHLENLNCFIWSYVSLIKIKIKKILEISNDYFGSKSEVISELNNGFIWVFWLMGRIFTCSDMRMTKQILHSFHAPIELPSKKFHSYINMFSNY